MTVRPGATPDTSRLRKKNQDYAVLRGSGAVVEIRLLSLGPDAAGFLRECEGTVTVLDHLSDDIWTPTAWVGRREHLDEEGMMEDAHNNLQTLLKVECGKESIYDRSFCSVHQVSMELRTVKVAFGMLVFRRQNDTVRTISPTIGTSLLAAVSWTWTTKGRRRKSIFAPRVSPPAMNTTPRIQSLHQDLKSLRPPLSSDFPNFTPMIGRAPVDADPK